ncbi:hypothetical protein ACFY1A_38995 [Streptomyces sp. NPDC001520]|uniref:hypothetical protein n=1 Tax=Streptomyces sp. NPDC001520 TaxID=3364581 RepID=UPI0036AC2FB5
MDFFHDNGRAPLPPTAERALRTVMELLEKAGPGFHHLACQVGLPGDDPLIASAHADIGDEAHNPDVGADVSEMADLTEVLAWGLVIRCGVLLMQTDLESGSRIQGWVIDGTGMTPLTKCALLAALAMVPQDPEGAAEFTTAFPLHSPGL